MTAYTYWRINCTANNDAWPSFQLSEAQWRVVAGGAKTNPIAITCAKGLGAPWVPANINDNDFTTIFATDGNLGLPASIVFQFGAATSFAELALSPNPTAGQNTYAPRNFTVDGSNDGTTWTNVLTVTGTPASAYTNGSWTLFSLVTITSIQAGQLAVIGVEQLTPANTQVGQIVLIAVLEGPPHSVTLGPGFKLPCWQPCTAYGTESIVIRFN